MHAVAPAVTGFGTALGAGIEPALVDTDAGTRQVHDPSDPLADKSGMVSFPRVDLVEEMSTLMDASRAYEANVRAFNTLRSMALRTLDIGSGS